MKYIYFISRSCRLHRKMKMSFYEDKTAEILSKIKGVKCLIISTALKKSQKITFKKKINGIQYVCLPNDNPEVFNLKFSKILSKLIDDNPKNYLIFNQFYQLDKDLFNFKLANFIYSVHCPFSANFSNRNNLLMKIFQNLKNFPMLLIKYVRELKSIKQLEDRKKSFIIYSYKFVQNYYCNNILYFHMKSTLNNKSTFIPLCIKKKQKIKINKFNKLKYRLSKYKLKICFIGRVSISKGINHCLNLAKMFKYNNNVVFYIGGSTDLNFKKQVLKFKKKNKLKNLILNLDGVNNEDVCSLYSLFDISLHLSNIPEGTSYSIMESMISKCIPISNYSSEMIKSYGYIFENSEYHEINRIINKFLKNKNLKELKFNSSLHIKRNYSEEMIIKKYKNILTI